jgi:hypothetical protein
MTEKASDIDSQKFNESFLRERQAGSNATRASASILVLPRLSVEIWPNKFSSAAGVFLRTSSEMFLHLLKSNVTR